MELKLSEVFYRLVITCPKWCEVTWGSPSLSLGWEPHQCCWHVLERMLFFPKVVRNDIPREEISIWKEMPATSTLNSRSIDWVGFDQNHWRACSKIISCGQDLKDTKRDSYQIYTDTNPFWSQIFDAWRWYKLTENFDQERSKNLAGRHICLQDYWWQRARWGWYRTRSPPQSQNKDGRFQPFLPP